MGDVGRFPRFSFGFTYGASLVDAGDRAMTAMSDPLAAFCWCNRNLSHPPRPLKKWVRVQCCALDISPIIPFFELRPPRSWERLFTLHAALLFPLKTVWSITRCAALIQIYIRLRYLSHGKSAFVSLRFKYWRLDRSLPQKFHLHC